MDKVFAVVLDLFGVGGRTEFSELVLKSFDSLAVVLGASRGHGIVKVL